MMAGWTFQIILIAFLFSNSLQVLATHEDAGLDIYQLVDKHGYNLEVHNVQTEDGYILELERIPGRKNEQISTKDTKPPVLMMHGILSSAPDWVNIGPNKSLAYKLVDQGFDVWLGNARGTTRSRKHITYDPDTDAPKFWNFTFHEIGFYDLPAKIDYILEHTKSEQLQYVGFSQGTAAFFVLTSSRPEYNQKIKLMTALAPVATMTHFKNPILKFLANYGDFIDTLVHLLGLHEAFPFTEFYPNLAEKICKDGQPTQELCSILLWSLSGYDREQHDAGFITTITTNAPAGSATRQLIHFFQIVKNGGVFRRFTHPSSNELAPEYDLTQITAPVALYYGENDWMSSEIDVQQMSEVMGNVVRAQLISFKAMTHLDFIWAIDVDKLVFEDALELMIKYK